jgi:hypothetical protein
MAKFREKTTLLSLPAEILITLPSHLHDIEDFKNLASTCRTLRDNLSSTSPRTILRLAAAATRTFFRPSPHFLVAACARQLGAWARLSAANNATLRTTFLGGIDAVLYLCLEHTGLTMERIRELHAARFSTINPAIDLIDKCVGAQWYSTPNFWNGGVDDAYTIDVEPPETFFHLVIYGGLFAGDFDAFLSEPAIDVGNAALASNASVLGVDTRLEYVKYCIPDWASYSCASTANDVTDANGVMDPRRAVQPVGPYEQFAEKGNQQNITLNGSQIGLSHLLDSTRWGKAWTKVRAAVGGDIEEIWTRESGVEWFGRGWKQTMWEAVVLYQGLEGMELLREGDMEGDVEGWRAKLMAWRGRIERMGDESEPNEVVVGRQKTYVFPDLKGDLDICSSGYCPGQ